MGMYYCPRDDQIFKFKNKRINAYCAYLTHRVSCWGVFVSFFLCGSIYILINYHLESKRTLVLVLTPIVIITGILLLISGTYIFYKKHKQLKEIKRVEEQKQIYIVTYNIENESVSIILKHNNNDDNNSNDDNNEILNANDLVIHYDVAKANISHNEILNKDDFVIQYELSKEEIFENISFNNILDNHKPKIKKNIYDENGEYIYDYPEPIDHGKKDTYDIPKPIDYGKKDTYDIPKPIDNRKKVTHVYPEPIDNGKKDACKSPEQINDVKKYICDCPKPKNGKNSIYDYPKPRGCKNGIYDYPKPKGCRKSIYDYPKPKGCRKSIYDYPKPRDCQKDNNVNKNGGGIVDNNGKRAPIENIYDVVGKN